MVEGVQVTLPSYEEAVYGADGNSAPPTESRVQIVLSEGPQADSSSTPLEQAQAGYGFTSASTAASSSHSETVLVHQMPSSSASSSSWAAEQPGAAARLNRRQSSESSDQHSLLSVTSAEDYSDGKSGRKPHLKWRLTMFEFREKCKHCGALVVAKHFCLSISDVGFGGGAICFKII